MTIEQVRSLRDSAAEAGDSEASGGNYFPRVVAKLADTTLDLHAQLQQEREGREKLEKFLRAFVDGQSLLRMFEAQEHASLAQQPAPDTAVASVFEHKDEAG